VNTQPKISSLESHKTSSHPQWLDIVQDRVGSVRFGTVQIVIHEGRVTQVDSTERTRLPAANAQPH